MSSLKPTPPILAAEIHGGNSDWADCGPDDHPNLWIKAHWTIGGVGFHVDAFRVERDADGLQRLASRGLKASNELIALEEYFEKVTDAFDPDGGYTTVMIDDHDYVIFIYPFCP